MAIKPSVLSNSYVKFVRTTAAMWGKLTSPDTDTLYFVIAEDNTSGSLYLGNVLIASSLDVGMKLNDLTDVFTSAVANGDVLIYNGANWVNKPISDFQPVAMIGATADKDGEGGLVPVPVAGEQNLYLRGDGTWADPTVQVVANLNTLQSQVTGLSNDLTRVVGSDTTKSMRTVAKEEATAVFDKIVADAPEAFDTLQEIAAWIAGSDDTATDAADMLSDIANLKETVYGDGTTENPGLVTTVSTLTSDVGTLTTAFNNLSNVVGDSTYGLVKTVNTHTTQIKENADAISALGEKLMWNELIEE